ACHAVSLSGGMVPVKGFHSTIESPDSVSLVAPPTRTMAKINAATATSHSRSARLWEPEDAFVNIIRAIACRGYGELIGRQPPARNHPRSLVDAHSHSQACRRHRAHRPGRRWGVPGDGRGETARDQGKRGVRGTLLCRGGAGWGASSHATCQMDGAGQATASMKAHAAPAGVTVTPSPAPPAAPPARSP